MENQVLLSVTDNGGVTKTVELEKNKSLIVGSGPNCRLVLAGDNVNSMHCMIWLDEENDLHIKDWNTGGKTVLNGEPIDSETTFSLGDKLDIGSNRIVPVLNADPTGESSDPEYETLTNEDCLATTDELDSHENNENTETCSNLESINSQYLENQNIERLIL